MGYEQWPNKYLSPHSIELDPDNPRLPGLPPNASQAEIIKEMFEAGKVRDMVRSIGKAGYFPDQRVVVIRKPGSKSKFIVIEGNRRVCACQTILKPSLAPEKHRRYVAKWADLAEPVLGSFEKVPVVIAPSRHDATQLIVSRHLNQAPVRSWSRFAQGKFAINALKAGEDIEFVAEETGLQPSELKKAVQESRLFDLFLGLDWSEDEKTLLLENVDAFPIDALSRILKSPATRAKIGAVEFDSDGYPEFKWEQEKTSQFLKRLIYDSLPQFAADPGAGGKKKARLNTRTTNSQVEIGEYLDSLPDEVKPTPSGQVTSAKDLVQPEEPSKTPDDDQPTKKRTPRAPRKKPSPALQADIECTLKNDKARILLEELQAIKPDEFPTATALLLRALLEVALIARMRLSNTWGDCIAKHAPANFPGFVPGLDKILTFASTSEKTIPDDNLRKALKDQRTVPKDFLNLVAHNDQHLPVASDVKEIATRLTPLLRFLLGGQ